MNGEARQILIIDLGGQYVLLINRVLLELGVQPKILPPNEAGEYLKKNSVKGIIASGGAASVSDPDAPKIPENVFRCKAPGLFICLGAQLLTKHFGGKIGRIRDKIEYSRSILEADITSPLFAGLAISSDVWTSHRDSILEAPGDFRVIGNNHEGGIQAIEHQKESIWGLIFHPEVEQTEFGHMIFQNFLRICGAAKDWSPGDTISTLRKDISDQIPKNAGALLALSGGVDSTVAAVIAKSVLGDRLIPITLDTGGLREGELKEIIETSNLIGCPTHVLKSRGAFLRALGNKMDPEKKRKAFQRTYFSISEAYAGTLDPKPKFLIQGTTVPDVIESARVGEAVKITTHHNVGAKTKFKLIDPLRNLFKPEVRALARMLDLPEEICEREPFPGPGGYCRISWMPVTKERLDVWQWAQAQVDKIISRSLSQGGVSQKMANLLPKARGVKGDGPSFGYCVSVRVVLTSTFMTAKGVELPSEIKREIRRELTKHPAIGGNIFFNESDKPPAKIELE